MEPFQIPPEEQHLRRPEFLKELLRGIAVTAGLALLWVMEAIRNLCFRVLDWLGVPARRRRRASAFPPGRPRRQPASD